ncbi:T9SS type A sorting domain-containing protein [uncultured Kordia sp.]|uniref:T9SS type A sorting domain-containing protein n=1 Tax=uncultured Kordia sp. TaxID=507699 RepID=UPI0034504B22
MQIVAYLNPVTNYSKISRLETDTDYLLYSVEGKLIRQGRIQNGKAIDFSNIKKGLYFLKINANTIFKIIKN